MRRLHFHGWRIAAVVAATALVTAACGIGAASTTGSAPAGPSGQPVTVGISLPLSGPGQAQGFQADGQACLKGYQLWASDVNSHGGLLGHPVRLVVMNDKGQPGLTKADYRTLITQKHVDLTLAPFSSLLTVAAIPVTSRYGYPLVAGSAGAPLVYQQRSHDLFSTNVPVIDQMVPFAKWVLSLPAGQRPLTAAYPMVLDPFADPPVMKAKSMLTAGGIKNVYSPPAYQDVHPAALAADARQVAATHADIVVLGSVDAPTVAAFVHEFIKQHYTPKIFIAAAGPDQGQAFLNLTGTGNADGIMVPNGWYGGFPNALSHVMVQDYIAKYGGTADGINADVAESYSAGQVIAGAVTATHGLNRPELIKYLHSHTLGTVLGPVRFSSVGENQDALKSALIFQWQQGGARFVQVLPRRADGSVPILTSKPGWAG